MAIDKFFKKVKKEIDVIKGDATKDKFFSSQRDYDSKEAALEGLKRAKEKLFHVNGWSNLPGIASRFRVYDAQGNPIPSGIANQGDFLFINLPGPTPETWVQVIDHKLEKEAAEFTVRPSHDPREQEEKKKEIEHFFADEATSTFKVELKDTTLFAYEIGEKESINNKGKEAGGHQLVNTLIAIGGWLLFQEIQWQKLTSYLVHNIEVEDT